MPSQFITWNWGKVDEDTNPRYLQPADLVKLINCVRDKDGRLSARGGVTKSAALATLSNQAGIAGGPSLAAPASIEASTDTVIYRDVNGAYWVRDEDSGKVRFAGYRDDAYPSWYTLPDTGDKSNRRPLAVKTGTQLWHFALGQVDNYQRTIFSTAGETLANTVLVGATAIVSYAACVDNAGIVNVVYVTGGNTVTLHRFSNLSSNTPNVTTWRTEPGAAFIGIDIANDSTNNRLIVVAQSSVASGADRVSGILRSIGTPSGGVATATSFTTSTGVGASAKENTFGVKIFADRLAYAGGFYYIGFFQQDPATPNSSQLRQQKVTLGTPSTVVDSLVDTFSSTNGLATGSCAGLVNGSGVPVVYFTFQGLKTNHGMLRSNNLSVRRSINAAGPNDYLRSVSVASTPWYVAGHGWFMLVHFNDWDDDNSGTALSLQQTGAQNAYYVRRLYDSGGVVEAVGNYACGVLEGDSQAVSFFGTLTNATDHIGADFNSHVVTPVALDASRTVLPLLSQGAARTRPGCVLATIDHNPTFYSTAPGIVPGGAVATIGPKDELYDAAPLVGPFSRYSIVSTTGGAYTGTNYITYCYAFRQANGDVKLSPAFNLGPAPTPETFTAIGSATISLPTLPFFATALSRLGATFGCEIWIYGSENGLTPMYFQDAVPNSVNSAVQVVIYPQNWKGGKTPALPTTGGGIPYIAPPACKIAWQQGTRVLMAGCDGEIWQSFEKRSGRSVSWNPVLNFTLPDGAGDVTAGCELDANSSVIFTAKGVYVSTGNPDERGTGGTTVAGVNGEHGCTNPASVTKGPLGVYWADQNGRMCLLQGSVVTDISAGMVDSKGKTWVSAVNCPAESERLIRWQASDGTRLTLQYAYLAKDGSAPWGTWVPETGLGLPTSVVGARLIDGVHVAIDSAAAPSMWSPGSNYYDGTSATPVLINFKTGKNSPAGFMTSFDLDQHIFSVTYRSGNATYDVTITSDGTAGTSEVHHVDASTEPDFGFRATVMRAREFELEVQQLTATGLGHYWDGVVAEVKTDAKIRGVTPARMIP
jgi:hypothetical protein